MSESAPSRRRASSEPLVVNTPAARDRALVTSVAATLMARAIGALATLINIGLAARALTPAELGVVSVLSALLVYFSFGDFGMGSVVMTRVPPAQARDDIATVRLIFSSALSAMTIVAAAIITFGVTSIWYVPWRSVLGAEALPWSEVRTTVMIFIVAGAVGIVATVGSRVLAAYQRGALIRVCDSFAAVASVGAVAGCVVSDGPLWTYLLAIYGPFTASLVFQLAYVMLRYPYLRVGWRDLNVSVGLRFLRDGVTFAVVSLGWVIAYTLDAIVVAAVLGAPKAAVFSIAARLFGLVGGTLTIAGQQMWPAMGEALARGDVAWVRARFRQSLLTTGTVAALSSAVLVLAGPAFARHWVGEDLVPPHGLFIAFGVWTVYQTVMVQYSLLLLAAEKIKLVAVLGIVLAGVNLFASVVLTQRFGLTGPIIGNLVAACSIQLVPMIVLTRTFMHKALRSADDSQPAAPDTDRGSTTNEDARDL